MKVAEASIAQVIQAASARMQEAEYISDRVDQLIGIQPTIMQYVVAHKQQLSVEEIVQVLFHATIVHESIVVATGRHPRPVTFHDLDAAASSTANLEVLAQSEADLAAYVFSNADMDSGKAATELASKILAHITRAFVDAT